MKINIQMNQMIKYARELSNSTVYFKLRVNNDIKVKIFVGIKHLNIKVKALEIRIQELNDEIIVIFGGNSFSEITNLYSIRRSL